MQPPNGTYAESFAGARAGEQNDDALFLNRYVQRLVALAGGKLHAKVRGEAEDVVQSAMLSFELRHKDKIDLQSRGWPLGRARGNHSSALQQVE